MSTANTGAQSLHVLQAELGVVRRHAPDPGARLYLDDRTINGFQSRNGCEGAPYPRSDQLQGSELSVPG